jgi:hypothetical protein
VHNNGPADYSTGSTTNIWMKQKVREILVKMLRKKANELERRTKTAPRHLPPANNSWGSKDFKQETFW